MAKVVLHIGTHKTATTTIQDMFAHNAALLQARGLIYPRFNKITGHHGLVTDWGVGLPKLYALPGGSRANLRAVADQYGKGDHTVFLSSEEFSRGAEGKQVDFAEVRDLLAGFDEIEVVCVLREQWQFIQSVYLEVSKARLPPKPPEMVAAAIGKSMIEGLWTDYNLLYDHLLKAFAPEQIRFLDFDTCRRAPGGILGAMLAHLGSSVTAEELDLVNDGQSNRSPQSLPAWAASMITEPKLAPGWLIDCTTAAFGVEYGEKARPCLFTRAEMAKLTQHFAKRNTLLAERLAPVQPGFAISTTQPGETAVFREDVNSSYWLRCSRRVFAAKAKG